MAGLVGPKSGLPVKKPTVFWASDEILVRPLRRLQCDGLHGHAKLDGSNPHEPQDCAKDMARWPQALCRRIANGCGDVLHRDRSSKQSLALPLLTPDLAPQHCSQAWGAPTPVGTQHVSREADTIPHGKHSAAAPLLTSGIAWQPLCNGNQLASDGHGYPQRKGNQVASDGHGYPSKSATRYPECIGCVRNRVHTDSEHIRIPGKCGASGVQTIEWDCPGCQRRLNKEHPAHTMVPGECRMIETRSRQDARRQPRGAHVPGAEDESSTMRPGPPAPDAAEEQDAGALEGRALLPPAGGSSSASSTRWDAPATVPRPPPGSSPPASARRKAAVTDHDDEHGGSDAPRSTQTHDDNTHAKGSRSEHSSRRRAARVALV